MTPFKICCMQSEAEIDMAAAAGAFAVGIVGPMPNGAGFLDDATAARLARYGVKHHGDKLWVTLLTKRTRGDDIAAHVAAIGANAVQLVDRPEDGAYGFLRARFPALKILQVVHVEDGRAVDDAREAAPFVDAVLLDSGKPSAATPTFGGTGDRHDWSISRRIVESLDKPVFLAGGLNPSNAAEALSAVRPFGLDICSGLRDRGRGDALIPERLAAFAAALKPKRP
ncbi:MAG: phosphoribosylanthranilate isomerase [Parvularculaceae bacterium]|nr:phosphoribosylanthranilate isomerase [Parvularculaceae bacterium]